MGKSHRLWLYQTLRPMAGKAAGTRRVCACGELAHRPVRAAPQVTPSCPGLDGPPSQGCSDTRTHWPLLRPRGTCASSLFSLLSEGPRPRLAQVLITDPRDAHGHTQGHATCTGTDTLTHQTHTHAPDTHTQRHEPTHTHGTHTHTQTRTQHTHTCTHTRRQAPDRHRDAHNRHTHTQTHISQGHAHT